MEEYFSSDCGFEVNKETLYNILSAELQSSSKIESLRTFQILPAVPTSIAKGTNLEKVFLNYFVSYVKFSLLLIFLVIYFCRLIYL